MDFSKIDWKSALLNSLAVIVLNFVFMFLVISVYTLSIVSATHSNPDPQLITDYANSTTAYVISVVSLVIFAFVLSFRIAKKEKASIETPLVMSSLVSIFILVMDVFANISISVSELLSILFIFVSAVLGFYYGKGKN